MVRAKWVSSRSWYWPAAVAMAGGIAVIMAVALPPAGATARTAGPHGGTAQAHTMHMAAGQQVKIPLSRAPFTPSAADLAKRKKDMAFLDGLPAPKPGPHPAERAVAQLTGPQTTLTGTRLPTDFRVWKDSTIPASCTTSCAQSTVNEPDTTASGRFVEQTSNWNMAYTVNLSASAPTWQYQNPYSLSSGFCCDQTVTYVPTRNKFIYEGLTLGTGTQTGFTLASANAYSPTVWCRYHFDGSSFGGTAGDVLDYPKIAYSRNYVYVTWNSYDSTGSTWLGTGLARIPTDALDRCTSFSYSYLTRTDNFTFGLTYGDSSADTFYWTSNWYTQGSGSGTNERIFWWPENSGSYFYADPAVAAYNFSGGSCASQDGVVTDWCTRLDPRWETAWISQGGYEANVNSAFAGDAVLGVAITAGPGGGDPFPYVIYEYFHLNSQTYISTATTFNDGFALAYAGCAPNDYGSVGCTMSYGGGTGTTHYYPGSLILVQDDISPTQPWAYSYNETGAGNASAWGDYMITQPFQPSVGPFITTDWVVNGSGTVIPHLVIWGRNRDTSGLYRWWTH
jgi:hypothetical protein